MDQKFRSILNLALHPSTKEGEAAAALNRARALVAKSDLDTLLGKANEVVYKDRVVHRKKIVYKDRFIYLTKKKKGIKTKKEYLKNLKIVVLCIEGC